LDTDKAVSNYHNSLPRPVTLVPNRSDLSVLARMEN